ncbi:caspase family protein [Synechococcus moorigangaii CMS01]|nr:caspase family protein [Synechococcus moorigangaii CMS01]
MTWRRRDFLQALGLTCGALGFSACLPPAVSQSAQALRQFQGRKLALLIGIDHYGQGFDLGGAAQDLKIQKNLLVHHFGFNAADVLTLQDEQATLTRLRQLFQVDLKALVQPEDLLFVHFSGYGTRLQGQIESFPALVLPDPDGPQAIALGILQQFLSILNPAQAILVLDTSFDPATRPPAAYWRPRTYPSTTTVAIAQDTETQSLSSYGRGRSPLIQLVAAAQGITPEIQINGAMAGLFTAALGEYLTACAPLGTVALGQTSLMARLPQDESQPATLEFTGTKSNRLYGVSPKMTLPATGTIVTQTATGLELYLGGLAPEIFQAIAPGSEFVARTETAPSLQLNSKTGVFGQSKTVTPGLTLGTPLQETKRHLPRNLTLKIALAEDLSRIERVDATSAFASIGPVASVSSPLDWVDYVFEANYQLTTITGKTVPGVVPASDANEAIKSSVIRLQPRLEQLLALKWLRLLVNGSSTQLPLKCQLQRRDRFSTVLTEKMTPLGLAAVPEKSNPLPSFLLAEKGLFHLENTGTQPLFGVGFAQSPKQELFLLTPKEGFVLTPAAPSMALEFAALRPLGRWQTYWIVGDRPFGQFQEQLTQLFGDLETIPQKLEKPLPLIQALLSDLQETPTAGTESNKENYIFSTRRWAGLPFAYVVAEADAAPS